MTIVRYGREPVEGEAITADSSVKVLFNPLVEELKCAIATRGDRIKVFPGLEAYANVEHVLEQIQPFLSSNLVHRVEASLIAIVRRLESILNELKGYHDEIAALVSDLAQIRHIIGHRNRPTQQIKNESRKWIKMLRDRLSRRGLEHDPIKLAHVSWRTTTPTTVIWQEWIRLYHSHEKGLYIAYDQEVKEFTNNPKEWLYRAGRHHFRKALGRGNVNKIFLVHEKYYCRMSQLEMSIPSIKAVLKEADASIVKDGLRDMRKYNYRARRPWRIRERDTGNLQRLRERLLPCIKEEFLST